MGKLIIAGEGMCGMATAMMLADDGHDVTKPLPGPNRTELLELLS